MTLIRVSNMTAGGAPRQCRRMTVRLGARLWWDPRHPPEEMSPEGRYESVVLVLFLCILLVIIIVNIIDYLAV